MTVTGSDPNNFQVLGIIVIENLFEEGQFSVADAIRADIEDYLRTGNIIYGVASWGLNLKVTDFDPLAIKRISGFPLRAQFGSVTYNSLSTFSSSEWLIHEFQQFAPQRCLVYPLGYADVPYAIADIAAYVSYERITLASSYPVTQGFFPGYPTLTGATGFYYDFAKSALVNASIPYIVRQVEENPNALPGNFTVLNY